MPLDIVDLPDRSTESPQRGCVVHVCESALGRGRVVFADGLPDERVEELDDLFAKFSHEPNQISELLEFMERRAIRGLAIVVEAGSAPGQIIPQALSFPFEPTLLDEPSVANLIPAAVFRSSGWSSGSQPKQSSPLGRWLMRYGIGVGVPVNLMIGFAFNVYRVGWRWWDFLSRLGILGVFVVVWWCVIMARDGAWHLIPGGVVILRSWRIAARRRFRIVSPERAFLFVKRVNQSWRVRAIANDGRRIGATTLTGIECAALLAAWRSPLPPPTLEQLEQAL